MKSCYALSPFERFLFKSIIAQILQSTVYITCVKVAELSIHRDRLRFFVSFHVKIIYRQLG